MITELRISNVKRIKAVAIAPDTGEPIILTGDNGQGKSSVLDAIFLALQNKGLEDPIRHGSSKAVVKLTLHGEEGEFLVERTVTKKTRSLRITGKDGNEIPSPQAFLDGLVGSLAFDPLEFVRMKPKAQAATIRELCGLDTSSLDEEYKATFSRRTEVNRTVATEEAQLDGMKRPVVPPDLSENEVSASELIAKRDTMQEAAARAEKARESAAGAIGALREATTKVAELSKALDAAKAAVEVAEKRADQLADAAEKAVESAPSKPELAALTQQIADVDNINAGIRQRREVRAAALRSEEAYGAKAEQVAKTKESAAALTAKLSAIEERKAALLGKVKMPVDGMTCDEDGVLIKGVRFDQLSTAEQVRTSAAVAMRGNPKLKLILVREGALLNRENLKAICDTAKDGGYQIFIEKFQEEPGSAGLHIEDGSVTHVDGKPVGELALEGVAL